MDTQDDNMFPSLSDAVLNDDYEKKQCTFKSARFLTRRYNPLTDRNRGKMKTMSLACKINLPVPGSSRTLQGDTSNYWVENKSPTLSTSLNQSSDYNSIPCNQAQRVFVDEIVLESIANKVTTNTIFGSPTKLAIDHSEQLNTSANVISSQILDENLSASTLASFEKSFYTSQKDMTIVDNRELNNTMFQSFDVTDMSQLHKSSNFRNKIINTFNVCEMSVCQLNDTIGMIKDKNDVKSKHSTFLDESNDSFMLNVPLNISKIHEFVKPNPISNQQDANYFYGLPSLAKTLVSQYKGIDKLYDWQNECLTLPAIEKRQNLIYALPTSGGKTLVAEILMLREVICRKKNVLFVVPFVSIVQEKVWGLSPFAVSLDFFVEEYAGGKGSYPPRKRRTKKSIYIATIEKGLGLVRSLTEMKRLSEIGLIVVDELHLLGEPNRGCTLEMLLTNVMYSGESIQIIGMSATIGNIEELASFLNAQIFTKDFRPVELKEYFKCGKDIMSINWKASTESEKITHSRKIDFGYSAEVEKIDPDHLGGLVMEVIPNSSCLIFCPTKKNAENVAVILCRVIAKTILEHRKQEKCALLEALREENNGENLLLSLIPWGVAYHHSGLAFEERRLIEECFRSGVLNVLCCTSTLAAGVNLPAQRVILRAPMVGRNFINLSMYKQMVGRAGRTGLAGQGDSILICAPFQTEKVKALLASPMDHVCSSLHADNNLNMRNFLLSAVASEIATNLNALKKLMKKSLLSVQAGRLNVSVKEIVKETVSTLFRMHAIVLKSDELKDSASLNMSVTIDQTIKQAIDEPTDDEATRKPGKRKINISEYTELTVSKLGKAAVRGGMQLSRAHQLNKDLKEAQNGLVLIGIGHLLYLVTPYDLAESIKPNLALYYSVLTSMNPDIAQTSRLLGFTQATEVQMAMGKQPKNIPERVLNRFYVTLMLYDLWNQVSLQTVSEKYQVNRGTVQSMMEQASTFASGVLRFCEEMDEFWAFKDLLKTFSLRLSHCCISELEPLMELPSVKKSRALQLYKAGFKTIKDIAKATPSDLMETIEHVTLRTANQLIAAAKLSLLEKVENLREEVQDVMDDMGILEE